MSEYGFCPMNDYQDFCQNGYPLLRRRELGGASCRRLTVLVNPFATNHNVCCLLSRLVMFLGSLYYKLHGPIFHCQQVGAREQSVQGP